MGHTSTAEVLLSVPGAELHKVVGHPATQELLTTGALRVGGGWRCAGAAHVLATPRLARRPDHCSCHPAASTGTFSISIVSPSPGAPPEQQRVEAGVDAATWPLGQHLPALKAASTIYSFALEHTKSEYLIVILPNSELAVGSAACGRAGALQGSCAAWVIVCCTDSSCVLLATLQSHIQPRRRLWWRRGSTAGTTRARSPRRASWMRQQRSWTSRAAASRRQR
jgi:hypothetical protein